MQIPFGRPVSTLALTDQLKLTHASYLCNILALHIGQHSALQLIVLLLSAPALQRETYLLLKTLLVVVRLRCSLSLSL